MAFNQYLVRQGSNIFYKDPSSGIMRRVTNPAGIDIAGLSDIGAVGGATSGDVSLAGAQKMFSDYEGYQAAQQKAQQQTYEQKFGTAAAKTAGQPYTEPSGTPTYAQKFYKEQGRFPTREEMIGAGTPVARPAANLQGTYVPGPSALKFYKESEIQRTPEGKIYLKPGVPVRWDAGAYGAAAPATPAAPSVAAGGEAPAAGGEPETPTKPTPSEAYEEKTYTLPDGTKLTTQQMIDMLSGKGYEETAPIDRAAKRKELAATAGLDKTMTEINELDKQINEVETAIRNRSEDLRARLRDTDATESEIQRELTAQLRPFDRKYRDLMAIRGVKAEVYNRGMTNVNQEISDLEAGRAEKISAKERKTNLMLKAYGLKTAEEEKAEKRNQWIVEQAQKLESGKTLTMPDGTKIVGAKAKDPDTMEYTYTDAANNKQYKVVADKTGKEISRFDMGAAYKEGVGEKNEFSDQENRKLEQAGLKDASRDKKLDYLYGENETTPLLEAKKLKAVVEAVKQYKDSGKTKKEVEEKMREDNKLGKKDNLPSTLQRAVDFVYSQ